MSRVSKMYVWAFATAACLLVAAAPALANSVRVGGGEMTVMPSPGISDALRNHGITVAPVEPAKVGKDSMTLVVVRGELSNDPEVTELEFRGGLRYERNGKTLLIHRYRLANEYLTAVVGGHSLRIARMKQRLVDTSGTHGRLLGVLDLSERFTDLINQFAGARVVHEGESFGKLTARLSIR